MASLSIPSVRVLAPVMWRGRLPVVLATHRGRGRARAFDKSEGRKLVSSEAGNGNSLGAWVTMATAQTAALGKGVMARRSPSSNEYKVHASARPCNTLATGCSPETYFWAAAVKTRGNASAAMCSESPSAALSRGTQRRAARGARS
ncbi:hypothetical protein MRX96_005250 [Rhipicephalus microplus]